MSRGQDLYLHAKTRIPGGTQLLSKRPEMFLPDLWPSYYERASGAEIWDLDGTRYLDMSYSGIGACVLGYADPDVNAAVRAALDRGSMTTLNCPEEVELADLLCQLHPWASMVRYARCGGEAMALAVRIARAATGRDRIAFSGYHGWHDWYLAANLGETDALDGHLLAGLAPAGVPRGLTGTALPFHYNRLDELEAIASRHGRELAAIVMEPIRGHTPEPGFLEGARAIADDLGAVLIFDEITAGFRLNTGGAHLLLGVEPDMAVFAKGMSNGVPMAAVIGRPAVMGATQTSFISSTYWTERLGPVAALATIRKHLEQGIPAHLRRMGQLMKGLWREAADQAGLAITVTGIDPLAHFEFDCATPREAQTMFTQLMLEKGFLATKSFYASFAHQESHLDQYRQATQASFQAIARALAIGKLQHELKGPVAHAGFQRLT